MKRIITATIATLAFVFAVPAGLAFAQATSGQTGGQGLEIGPPLLNVVGDPGQVVRSRVSVRDVTKNPLVVTNQINDFVANGEDGSPKILLDPGETSPYSIKNWITPLESVTLQPGKVKSFDIIVTIPKHAAPGGYYGVIRFTGTPPSLKDTGVSLSASVGALVLLKVNGDAKEQVSLTDFSTANFDPNIGNLNNDLPNSLFESAPFMFVEKFKNSGNLHEQPFGKITITDMFGNTVTEIKVNDPPRNVLPGSTRRFNQIVQSKDLAGKFLFGLYHAKLETIYGSAVTPLVGSLTFWILPWKIMLAVIVGLIVLFFAVRFAIRSYIRRTVGRSRGGRRR